MKTTTKNHLLLTVQDTTGHSEVELNWDPNEPEQVEAIWELFTDMKSKGYMFFKVKKKPLFKAKGEQIKDFDPSLKTMLMEKNVDWQPAEVQNSEGEMDVSSFNPDKESIDPDTQYVAAQPLAGG